MDDTPAGDAERFRAWLADDTPGRASIDPDGGTLAQDAIALAERNRERAASAAAGEVACRAGCAWCCHLPVMTSPEEVRLAWEQARDTLDAGALASIRRRARPIHPPTPRPCPFLIDDRCAVYTARPIACRGWNSTDADACRRAYALGHDAVKVPVHVRLRAIFANVGDALARGLEARGRPGVVPLREELDRITRE